MGDEKPLNSREIGKKLINILDDLLKAGNWEASLFLKASAGRLRELRKEAGHLAQIDVVDDVISAAAAFDKPVPQGYIQVYISLFQLEAINFQLWHRTIKALTEHSISRPIYRDVKFVQEFIRSKADIEHHGYLIVNIKEEDVYKLEQPTIDVFGHEMLTIKEGAVKLDNVIGFVLANKKRYVVKENGLVFVDEIK